MSSVEGPGDLAQIRSLAWDLYKSCKDSSDEFKRIAHEVANLHVCIKETEEHLEESKELSPTREQKLYHLTEGCSEVLAELKRLVDGYESLGTQAQRTWDRMRWGLEDLADVRSKIIVNTTNLTAFNTQLANSSTVRIEKRLNKFIAEVRGGLREGSVAATSTAEEVESQDVWEQLRRELEDVGISAGVVEENHKYISTWLQKAIANGVMQEADPNGSITPIPSKREQHGSLDSGYGGSTSGSTTYTPSITPIAAANEEFETQMRKNPTRASLAQSSISSTSSRSSQTVKVRKASAVSSALFKLLKKDTAIIEAASDGDINRVAKLISSGANVNARDRWGWSALSMCGYGGFPDIAKLLLENGADIDNIDVDGDTPMSLAENRGHPEMVFLLEEERQRRDLEARENDNEVPRAVDRKFSR